MSVTSTGECVNSLLYAMLGDRLPQGCSRGFCNSLSKSQHIVSLYAQPLVLILPTQSWRHCVWLGWRFFEVARSDR